MANPPQIHLDPIKYLNSLPQFGGNINDLPTFTKLVDRIYPILAAYDELSQLLFSDIIKSRIIGKAKEVLEINTQVQSWEDIKRTLNNNFGERKSCDQLYDEMRSVTFQTNTIDFYNDLKYKLRRLNNKSVIMTGEGEAANQVAINNQRSALHIFKNKMPEPMKTILACRNPTSLESAMDILYENGYDKMGKDGRIHPGRAKNNQKYETNPQPSTSKNKEQNHRQPQHDFYKNNTPEQNWRNKPNWMQHGANNQHNNSHNYQRRSQQPNQYQHNNSQNYQHHGQQPNRYQQPEPMDINNIESSTNQKVTKDENFQSSASENYHI